ncbi:hypothetical protein BX600DRAFT_485789 [Xylariales sp. PMI_506]|nr:hypothetical protein BX600DRAFT_485789 [Xylariales sp. PMI_506]
MSRPHNARGTRAYSGLIITLPPAVAQNYLYCNFAEFANGNANANPSTNAEKISFTNNPPPQQTPADLESQTPTALPPRKFLAAWRYRLFNTYRRLFSLVFLLNMVALSVLLWGIAYGVVSLETCIPIFIHLGAANTMVACLARSPAIINILFKVFCAVPRWAPLRLRHLCCKVFHLGGVHSGAGVSSCAWFLAFLAGYITTEPWLDPTWPKLLVLSLSIIVIFVLLAIILMAHPTVRANFHDTFESIHRFAGWSAILLFWALLLTVAWQNSVPDGGTSTTTPPDQIARAIFHYLVTFPTFWFLVVTTIAAIYPWLLLRRVPVKVEKLSSHAVRLHFQHSEVGFGKGHSVAMHPLRDWHSFATFTDRFDSPGFDFSSLVSRAGDWTSSVIEKPPTHLWVRAFPVYGFGYVMRVFRRVIMVTTGSGIGPCLSFVDDDDRPPMRVVWQTRDPVKIYGQRTLDLVHRLDPNAVIMDTSRHGRTDMIPVIINLFKQFGAEAICVISNPVVTKKLVFDLESRGYPAYGPIFDS